MKFGILISFVFIILSNNLVSKGYPSDILHKNFAMQCLALDSIKSILLDIDYSAANSRYNALEAWARDNDDISLQLTIRIYHAAFVMSREKEDDNVEKNLLDIIKIAEENNLIPVKAEGLELLATYYWDQKKYAVSLENFIYAYQCYEQFSIDEFPHKAEYIYEIGGKYYYFRDFTTAKKYFHEVWRSIPYEKMDNGISKLNTLALCYSYLQDYDSSTYYYYKALDYATKKNDEIWEGIISGNIGNNYVRQQKYDQAIPLLKKNLDASRKHRLMEDLAVSLSEYGALLLRKNEIKQDVALQLEALDVIRMRNLTNKYSITSRIYPNVAKAYAAAGLMTLAYSFADSAFTAKNLLEAERNMVFVSGVQHKIDIEKHTAELQKKEAEVRQQKVYRNGLLGGIAVVLLFAGVFFAQRNKIKKGKQQSDELLLNILPAEVAEELKSKGMAEAKQFEEVTVMFTDFKGFTQISERLTPGELVAEIDACFKAFDGIITKYTIEKIKTIGDSYMCVGGLPKINSTHAKDVVNAAIEIQHFMHDHFQQRLQSGKEPFEMRIGIHTGSVVAGIVGVKKFAYDIWGDTVNIASRMESSGKEGKINISGATYQLVKDEFTCAYRGKVEAKNKGEIDMYFVEMGRRIA